MALFAFFMHFIESITEITFDGDISEDAVIFVKIFAAVFIVKVVSLLDLDSRIPQPDRC
jgi:hypothetical protein